MGRLRDRLLEKQKAKVEEPKQIEAPSAVIEAEPVKQIPARPKPYQTGKISYNFTVMAPEFARRRLENKEPIYKIFQSMYPESAGWKLDKIRKAAGKLVKTNEYKEAVKELKKGKLAKAQEIVNKKLAWNLEEATNTLAFLINSTKEIIEEDLQVKFRISRDGKSWVKDPDGNKIKKQRILSDSAVRGMIEATKELNKVYGLTKGEAPTENRYTQINYVNSDLKE